jgi:hypothetical protein
LEQFQNPLEKYHTVGTVPKSNFGTVPTVLYCSIGFWNCSNSVVFFYWILGLFQQCCILLLDFGTVPTVWYFPIGFWSCSNSVVFFYWILELFQQCGIYQNPIVKYHTVETVPKSNRKIPHCRNSSKIQ